MQRSLQPELLDSLPFDHPDALHNRRDLRVINGLMGNFRWFARTLPPLLRAGDRVLELGAGTGELGRLLLARGLAMDGLDLWPRPADWPPAQAWHRAELCAFAGYAPYAAVMGNFILHQFAEADLRRVGEKLRQSARVLVFCEPVRQRRSQALFATAAPLLGANHVSRHDAHVSIAAGFRRRELPVILGLDDGAWDVKCSESFLGAYRMVAVRKA